jgi:hypothetical protein
MASGCAGIQGACSSDFIARSSSGCMQRVRRGWRDGLRINGRGRAGCYVTLATAWPAATKARRGHINTGGGSKNLNLQYCLSLLAGWVGRVRGGGWGGGRVGHGWPVRRCYAALRNWRSYTNTILALCVWSDGECDLMLAEILI